MGRPRKYENDAARKAAQRARDRVEWVQVPREVHETQAARLDALHQLINEAARRGDAIALECRAGSVETMLENLAKYFARASGAASDVHQ